MNTLLRNRLQHRRSSDRSRRRHAVHVGRQFAELSFTGVFRYDSAKTSWTQVTGNGSFVYSMAVAGDVLGMLATGPDVSGVIGVAQYGLTDHDWIPLTGSNTAVGQILVQDGNQLYMVTANGSGPMQVWQYRAPGNWTALTGANTSVKSASIATDNTLHMVAANNGGPTENWIYNGTPGSWSVVK